MDIEKTVWNILSEPMKGLGYNLLRVKMIGSKKLQIMAERLSDKSLDINDCVKISKFTIFPDIFVLLLIIFFNFIST